MDTSVANVLSDAVTAIFWFTAGWVGGIVYYQQSGPLTIGSAETIAETKKTNLPVSTRKPILVDFKNYLENQINRAYDATNVVRRDDDNDEFEVELKLCLPEVRLVTLSPVQRDRWLAAGEIPKRMRMTKNQYNTLCRVVEQRFGELFLYEDFD